METLEQSLKMVLLSDFYSSFLTIKQKTILEEYYYNDISLSEIARNLDVTRQAVKDALNSIQDRLNDLEDKLGVLKKYTTTKSIVDNALNTNNIGVEELKQKLSDIKKVWERN